MSKALPAETWVSPIATNAKVARTTPAALALAVLALTMPVVQAQSGVAKEHPQAPVNASIRAQLVGTGASSQGRAGEPMANLKPIPDCPQRPWVF
jgi:hypothetical protein